VQAKRKVLEARARVVCWAWKAFQEAEGLDNPEYDRLADAVSVLADLVGIDLYTEEKGENE